MPHFLILSPDRAGALDDRIAHRDAHIAYWTGQPGVVKVAGAMLDGDRPVGSSFVIEVADEAAARALLAGDPFTAHGVFAGNPTIQQIRPAIGAWLTGA